MIAPPSVSTSGPGNPAAARSAVPRRQWCRRAPATAPVTSRCITGTVGRFAEPPAPSRRRKSCVHRVNTVPTANPVGMAATTSARTDGGSRISPDVYLGSKRADRTSAFDDRVVEQAAFAADSHQWYRWYPGRSVRMQTEVPGGGAIDDLQAESLSRQDRERISACCQRPRRRRCTRASADVHAVGEHSLPLVDPPSRRHDARNIAGGVRSSSRQCHRRSSRVG